MAGDRTRLTDILLANLMYMADHSLSAGDVPALIARAADETAEEDIRVGAVNLLGLWGALPKNATKAFLRLTTSKSERLSLAAAGAIGAVLEDPKDTSQLVRAVQSRAKNEQRVLVRQALDESARILVGSSQEELDRKRMERVQRGW